MVLLSSVLHFSRYIWSIECRSFIIRDSTAMLNSFTVKTYKLYVSTLHLELASIVLFK
jgi:hypothetical protein